MFTYIPLNTRHVLSVFLRTPTLTAFYIKLFQKGVITWQYQYSIYSIYIEMYI